MAKKKPRTDKAPRTKADRDARAVAELCRTCKPPASKPWCLGVCPTCYRVYARKKKAGEITYEKAVELGLISPKKDRGVKGGSGMEEAIKGLKQ
jgi:Fe-S-cluster-containing hydrogenase component 2